MAYQYIISKSVLPLLSSPLPPTFQPPSHTHTYSSSNKSFLYGYIHATHPLLIRIRANRTLDPLFAISIGLAAAATRINREEKEKGRSTQQTIELVKRRWGLAWSGEGEEKTT